MIDLYYWPTPNGWKVTILLEELAVPYRILPVNIGRGEQFRPEFLAISPNNRMPAIVDTAPADGKEPISIFESGAILMYLAEKSGALLPTEARRRYDVVQWVLWQVGGLGPMLGQATHFRQYAAEKIPYAIDRFTDEADRLFGVLERRLSDRAYLAGEYSIADIACFPWTRNYERVGVDLAKFPNVKRWFDAIAARPAVQRGLEVGKDLRKQGALDDEAKRVLFGQRSQR